MEQFTDFLAQHIYLDYLLRTLLSVICGFALGIERKLKRHTVGIRTLVLMSLSCNLLGILSFTMADCGAITGDPTRIAAGVVTGIGFLGGGAILQQGFNIRGLTSAAVIFTASAIGLCCGSGLCLEAMITLALALIVLFTVNKLEHKFFPEDKIKVIHLEFECSDVDEDAIQSILTEFGLIVLDTDVNFEIAKDSVSVSYMVKAPKKVNTFKLAKKISKINRLKEFSFSKK